MKAPINGILNRLLGELRALQPRTKDQWLHEDTPWWSFCLVPGDLHIGVAGTKQGATVYIPLVPELADAVLPDPSLGLCMERQVFTNVTNRGTSSQNLKFRPKCLVHDPKHPVLKGKLSHDNQITGLVCYLCLLKTRLDKQADEWWRQVSALDRSCAERRSREVIERKDNDEFRKNVLVAYGNRCAITQCAVIEALDAAHIFPHRDERTSRISNGIALRADLHRLFDRYLLWFDPSSLRVCLSDRLAGTEYEKYLGCRSVLPERSSQRPHSGPLGWRAEACRSRERPMVGKPPEASSEVLD